METYIKLKHLLRKKTNDIKNNNLKKIANEFKKAEINGKNIAENAQYIKNILKNFEKTLQKTNKTVGENRIKNFEKEQDFVNYKLNPELEKFEKLCNELNNGLVEIKTFLGIKSGEPLKTTWISISEIFTNNKDTDA